MKVLIKSIIMTMAIIVTLMSISVKIEANSPCATRGCGRNSCTGGRYCGLHTCCKNGCYKYRGNNGTVYCPVHAAEYVEKAGYTPCSELGCYGRRYSGSDYCSDHKCKNSYCHKKKASGSDYCSAHNPSKKTTTTKKSSSTNTKKKSSSSSKKKYDAYDVYDYKSAQDFADDKYEEFFDYEDDYEDEDEAYDAAEDYWRAHH